MVRAIEFARRLIGKFCTHSAATIIYYHYCCPSLFTYCPYSACLQLITFFTFFAFVYVFVYLKFE